jgi:TPR repeat protein
MSDGNDNIDYLQGYELLQNLIRGDAMIGLIPDVEATLTTMTQALRTAAAAGHARAFCALGDCYAAVLAPIGAFNGVFEPELLTLPADTCEIVDENAALQAALRYYFEGARLGRRDAVLAYVKWSRHSNEANRRRSLAMLNGVTGPTGAELCWLGYVHNWLGEFAQSAAALHRAVALGNHDAEFELYICYAQGLGVEANLQTSQQWLQRAADAEHPRALYNLGAACASGTSTADGAPDFAKAAQYYERAAKLGNGRAAGMLGVMVLNQEMPGTPEQASEWLDLGDSLGFATWDLLDAAGLEDPRGDANDGPPW